MKFCELQWFIIWASQMTVDDRGARLTNREIRFEVHILNFAFATLLGTVWTNIDRPLLFLLDCPLSVLLEHQQLILWTVHLSSIDRPLKFKTVHFRNRPLSPLWSVHFHPDLTVSQRTSMPLAFWEIQEFRMLRASRTIESIGWTFEALPSN